MNRQRPPIKDTISVLYPSYKNFTTEYVTTAVAVFLIVLVIAVAMSAGITSSLGFALAFSIGAVAFSCYTHEHTQRVLLFREGIGYQLPDDGPYVFLWWDHVTSAVSMQRILSCTIQINSDEGASLEIPVHYKRGESLLDAILAIVGSEHRVYKLVAEAVEGRMANQAL